MEAGTQIIQMIKDNYAHMSKGHKRIADYMLSDYDKVVFITASKLGKLVNVSESTVVRFATMLGFKGYPQMQKALQDMVRERLTSVQRVGLTADIEGHMVLQKVLKADINNLKATTGNIDYSAFDNVVDRLFASRTIYIVGMRASAPVALFLSYYLNFVFPNVRMVNSELGSVFEQMMRIGEDDMLIAISFPRYSSRTVDSAFFAKERGAYIASITDTESSPLMQLSSQCLLTFSDISSFADSLVAPMSVANALVVAAGIRKKDEIGQMYEALEQVWDRYGIYAGRDI